jgi:hypothetical protein
MSARMDRLFRIVAAAALAGGVACSHPAPASAPAPEAAAPRDAPHAAPPPNAVAGTFALQAVIQGRTIPAPPPAPPRRPPRGRAAAVPLAALLQLTPTPAAAPDPGVPSGTQLRAEVALPGYTMPPRGRATQAAAWWPGGGDSVTVRWVTPRNAAVSLRGILRGDTLSGDVWYTLLDSGSEFLLGTWTAVRRRTAR